MNVLLIGSGAREHALAWKLAQSPGLTRLYAAPGNPGIARLAELVALDPADQPGVAAFCRVHAVALVVIGPEAPLVAGLADHLRAEGVAVFGPSAAAARLEGSKGFTKALCSAAGIPTADYEQFSTKADALAGLDDFAAPYVIKADGLAAGKGVIIAPTRAEAEAAIDTLFGGSLGAAAASVVIEDHLAGEEASFFALTDGTTIIPFGSAQDHKRVGEGDTGPNTGGMGAYSPAAIWSPDVEQRVLRDIIAPTVSAMAAHGTPYSGILFAGLMLTADGPKLIEYNARFGDPECQVLMLRLESDLLALMLATAHGKLARVPPPRFADDAALTVVLAAQGYPEAPQPGGAITGIERAEALGARVFQAGTRADGDHLVASGGRVLSVSATGATVAEARAAAYRAVDAIDFPGGFCRRDIGWRAITQDAAAQS